jgi:hypothetical protein
VIAIAIGDTLADVAAQGVGACLLGQQLIKAGEVTVSSARLVAQVPRTLPVSPEPSADAAPLRALVAFLREANEAL